MHNLLEINTGKGQDTRSGSRTRQRTHFKGETIAQSRERQPWACEAQWENGWGAGRGVGPNEMCMKPLWSSHCLCASPLPVFSSAPVVSSFYTHTQIPVTLQLHSEHSLTFLYIETHRMQTVELYSVTWSLHFLLNNPLNGLNTVLRLDTREITKLAWPWSWPPLTVSSCLHLPYDAVFLITLSSANYFPFDL